MKLFRFTLKAPYPTNTEFIYAQASSMSKAIQKFEATYKYSYSCVEEVSPLPIVIGT